ncbi:MAG: extracellular solute-binding protein, partial [Acetivibrio sp.]
MKKRLLSVLLSTTLAASLLVGCKGNNTQTPENTKTETTGETKTETSGEKTKIRMTYWNSEETVSALLEYLKTAVPDVEVEYQFIDNSNYDTIVDTQLSAGEGPDLICESPGSSLKHARLGYLAKLDELAANYSPAGTSVYSYDGSTYALPGISWFEGIYFNKTLFEENNIALPKTFDEYIAVCK